MNQANKILIRNTTEDGAKLSAFLQSQLSAIKVPDETYNDLRLAIEETFINIISYAYTNNEEDTIFFELTTNNNQIRITFTDAGIAFNPLTDCDKNIDEDDKCEGGMGIHLIKSLTDAQEYKRIEQRNVFTLTKNYT